MPQSGDDREQRVVDGRGVERRGFDWNRPLQARLPVRYVAIGLIGILSLSSLVLSWWYQPNYGAGVDEASYFLAAKGLATHFDPAYYSSDPVQFVPENMVEVRPGVFYPKYPIGYPMLCAAAYRIGGPEAAFVVSPVMMVVALAGTFFLARLFVSDLLALAVTFFLAIHPAMLHFGVAALSHASDLACCVWAMYFAFAWYKKPSWIKALAAGGLIGFAMSIRYTEALLVLPAGYLMALQVWDAAKKRGTEGRAVTPVRRMMGHVVLACVGGVAGVLPLLWYHTVAFGSPLRTGYALTGESEAFSWEFLRTHFSYAMTVLSDFSDGLFVFFPLAMVALAVCWKWRLRAVTFLALWAIPNILLYIGYYWINGNTPVLYTRFFLPSYPALMIAVVLGAELLVRRRQMLSYGLAALTVGVAGVNLLHAPNQATVEGTAAWDALAVQTIRKHLPNNGVIIDDQFAAFSIIYYTDMTIYYPPYFFPKWINTRLRAATREQPADFNPLRRQRFAEALAGKSVDELAEMLTTRLDRQLREGKVVGMLVKTDKDISWENKIASGYKVTLLERVEGWDLSLYRLELK